MIGGVGLNFRGGQGFTRSHLNLPICRPRSTAGVAWYTLYAFVVGRGYDQYGEPDGYHFSSYVVLPRRRDLGDTR